jgi:chemotaxis protein MotB
MIRIALIFSLAGSIGCVSKAKYERLEVQYEQEAKSNDRLKAELKRREQAAKNRLESYQALMNELKPLIDRDILQVEVVDGRASINMTSDVLFTPGSSELSEEGHKTVSQIARILGKRSDRDFQVQGHTDSDPISTEAFPSNWHLGAARAINVTRTMIQAGMPKGRISAATFGPTQAVEKNDTAIGKAKNRRIEIVLQPDLTDLPGYEDMMKRHGRSKGKAKARPKQPAKPRPPTGK